jgi:hypothetical protein
MAAGFGKIRGVPLPLRNAKIYCLTFSDPLMHGIPTGAVAVVAVIGGYGCVNQGKGGVKISSEIIYDKSLQQFWKFCCTVFRQIQRKKFSPR